MRSLLCHSIFILNREKFAFSNEEYEFIKKLYFVCHLHCNYLSIFMRLLSIWSENRIRFLAIIGDALMFSEWSLGDMTFAFQLSIQSV